MIVGKRHNHSNHDEALTILLDTARSCNVWLNYVKLQDKKDEIDFFGKTYTTSSCKPAQSMLSGITAMSAPTCKKQVQSFIGIINYLSKFSAWLSEPAEPISELFKEKVPFKCGPEHECAFDLIKKEIASAPVLTYYNTKKQTVLQTDTSIKGLGACLLQDDKPVYFVSKALTDTLKGYVTIELEWLAVVWAMEKFHHFFYRSYFILERDQKPLEVILLKSINQVSPRL